MHPRKTHSARCTWREGKSFVGLTFAQSFKLVANRMDPFLPLITTLCCDSLRGWCRPLPAVGWHEHMDFFVLYHLSSSVFIHTCHCAATYTCGLDIFHLHKSVLHHINGLHLYSSFPALMRCPKAMASHSPINAPVGGCWYARHWRAPGLNALPRDTTTRREPGLNHNPLVTGQHVVHPEPHSP